MPKKRKTTSEKSIYRQWLILQAVPRYPGRVTVPNLKQWLDRQGNDVSNRTIERDLIALSRLFPLIANEESRPYGWSWQPRATPISIPNLTGSQALAFHLVRLYLEPLLPASVTDELRPYFEMAARQLTVQTKGSKIAKWAEKVRTIHPTQRLLAPSIDRTVQRTVYDALLLERQLRLEYAPRGEKTAKDYVLHPLGVVQRGPVTYLIATAYHFSDVRQFALHRAWSAEVLDAPASKQPGFSLDSYIESGALDFGGVERIKLEALFDPQAALHLEESPLAADQTITATADGRMRVKAMVSRTPQLVWWLLGFGDQVEVCRPAILRDEMAGITNRMVKKYT